MLWKLITSEGFYQNAQVIGVLIFFGVLGVFSGLRAFSIKRRVEDTACSRISSAPQGLAEIQGQAWPTINLKSIDGRPLCYWHIQVQKYKKRGKNSSWVTVHTRQTLEPVILTDGTGACLVAPDKADIHTCATTYYLNKLSREQREYLASALPEAAAYFDLSESFLVSLMGTTVRVIEKKILAGGPMYVRGEFATDAGSVMKAVGDYEGYVTQYQKITAPGYQARLFDSNRDGSVSDKEFINGHSFAANAYARKDQIQTISTNGYITWSTTHGLLIADTHQKYFLKRFPSILVVAASSASLGLGVFLLLIKLGIS